MTNLISVIVPVYNAEQYLERCINSIANQTYRNLEIILINDGSSDSSKTICNSFATNDTRITVVNQQNGGSSIARNTGLEIAKGDFISFIDSDDYIEPIMLEKMLNLLLENNLEVVEIERNSAENNVVFDDSFKIENSITATKRIINTTSFQVWKRLYKRSIVENMRFIPNIIHQDVFFTIDVINKVNSIGFLNSPLYQYNRESIGIIRSNYSEMKRDIAIRATEYIKSNIADDIELNKVVNNYIVGYYTDHYFLLSRNTNFDQNGNYRKKLRTSILKSLNVSNVSLRSFMVIVLPRKVIEFISVSYKAVKSKQP
ncbi:glycosyltransferase [uncultured Winogradskyella sp.]|uniref:glycosyltransferase n=1 Tax=uncultured Winogradskyella sp. TaxID=395353 RepID=UPI002632A4FE|nr:glycosyltransferase [uncultured Winogradskyella sp.]|tara:strand:- start:29357 stop:30301 length:945 start_codon:yes stop_codon:yes gene_type:complete